MTKKSLIRSHLKGVKAKRQLQMRFFVALSIIFIAVFAIGAILDPDSAGFCMKGLGGVSLANMMAIGSVGDVSDKHTFGKNLTYQVYLIDITQVDRTVAFPKPNANRQVGTIPMLAGQYMQYFEAHDFPTYLGTGEKGDISSSGKNAFTIIMGGIRDQLMTYAEDHIGGKFILLFKEIESTQWEIIGSVERPVILQSFEAKNDKDGRYVTYNFERESVIQYHHYIGTIITVPAGVHSADATNIVIKPEQSRYSIPDGTAATYAIISASGITATDKGRFITFEGAGTDKAATIPDGGAFVLEDGATWTAKAGSSITFQILDAGTLVEVSGTRIQTA